jgi:hypothetical protein
VSPAGKPRAGIAALVRVVGIALAGAAVLKELRKPRADRQWHGTVAGFLPYDFRRPTLERVRASLWNPDSPRLFTPQVFGVGWTVNLGRLFRGLRPGSARR